MNALLSYPSLWNLARNPVFRRHAASRLRPMPFAVWLIVTQVIAAFIWSVGVFGYLMVNHRGPIEPEFGSPEFERLLEDHGPNAYLMGWLLVLVFQGLLVVMKGTFSVATGVAREANEGMIEAELLSPLSTGHKVLGQLLGLPLLENVLALLMIPWALASAWLGDLSLVMMAKIYLLFATSALLHHAIGLVAGTIIRQKILAGTISQVMVILLHFVLPLFSGFGIGMISHLGVESAILHEIVIHTPRVLEPHGFVPLEAIADPVSFFRWEVALPGYHWVITVTALAALLTVLARRWNDQDSQKLGKIGTTVLAAWILTLTCGELVPTFWSGKGFEGFSAAASIEFQQRNGMPLPPVLLEVFWLSGFGLVLGWINLLLTSSLVPSPEARARLRRGARPAPWWSDGRNALGWVAGISLLCAAAWALVAHALFHHASGPLAPHWGLEEILWMAVSLVVPACAWHLLVLWRGWKLALFANFAVGVVPLMIAFLGLIITAEGNGWPKWVAGLSSLVMPGLAGLGEIGEFSFYAGHGVFRLSVALHAAAALFFAWKVCGKGHRARLAEAEPAGGSVVGDAP